MNPVSDMCVVSRSFLRLVLAAALLLAGLPALAQLGSGQIEGTVLDQSGAVIPDAQVTVRNQATGVERILTSDATGRYRAVNLAPGLYSVKAQKSGFQPVERQDVQVTVGSTTTADITLQVAAAAETVVVTEAAPVMDIEKTDVSSTVSEEVVTNVPVIGRRFDNYVLLTPAVTPDGTFGLTTYRGVSGLYNNNTIDGADNNQAFFSEARGRTRAVYTYSQAAVKEFQVGLSNFNAEYGRAAGGTVNAVTKSGTNTFHGEAFYFIRDDFSSAREPTIEVDIPLRAIGDKKPPERRQQFGFAMGGPIKKDKLFWFLNYDQQVRNFPYVVNFNSRDFIGLCPGSTNVIPGLCPGSPPPPKIPVGGCNILTVPNEQATCEFFFSERTVVNRHALNEVALGKLDWVITPNHNFSVSYNFHQWRSVNGIRTPLINFNAETDNGFDSVRTDSLYFRLNSVIRPTLINEARFQFARDNEIQRPNGPGPSTTATGGFSFGMPNFLPRPAFPFEKRFQWVDNFSVLHGRHSFKFGFDINYVRERQINLFQGGGVYSYSNFDALAGDCPLGALAFGCVPDATPSYGSYTQAFDLRVLSGELPPEEAGSIRFTTTDWNFYLQDTFKLRSDLTLNYGIRYEYQQLPQPDVGNPAFPLTARFNQDKNNWGPRLGLAWDIAGRHKTILRAGYGLIYGRTSNSALSSAQTDNGVVNAAFRFTPTTDIDPVTPGLQRLFYPDCFVGAVNSPNCTLVLPALTSQVPDIRQFSEDFARPYVHQAELSLEHEIFASTLVSATYAFSGGRRLPIFRDVNMPPPGNLVFITLTSPLEVNGQTLVPAGTFGPLPFYCIDDPPPPAPTNNCPLPGTFFSTGRPLDFARRVLQGESVVNSSYNGLILRAQRRMRRGVMFDVHFTWSKSIDDGQNSITFFGTSTTNFDPFNRDLDRARSTFDIRKRFVTTFIWQPEGTFDLAQGAQKKILGGWTFAGALTLQDGRPVTPLLSGFLSSSGTRAIDTGSSNGSGGTFRAPFLGRNSFEGFGFANMDFRIARSISIGERYRVELIAESFNIFNRTNFITVDDTAFTLLSSAMNVPTCGSATITLGNRCLTVDPADGFLDPRTASSTLNSPREWQFALKFFW